MSSSFDTLQKSLQALLAQPAFDVTVLQTLLSPAPIYIQDPLFFSHIGDLVTIITKDRNNDQKFTFDDIVVLTKDFSAIAALVTAIVLLLKSLPNVKVDYTVETSELFIYKILIYIFLVIVPSKTNLALSQDDKVNILTSCNMVYDFLIHSELVKNIIAQVSGWFKKEITSCVACVKAKTHRDVVIKQMPQLKAQLIQSVAQIDKSNVV